MLPLARPEEVSRVAGQALVVEDSEQDYQVLAEALQSLPYELEVTWARSYREARRALISQVFDIAFVDLVLDAAAEPYVERWEGLLVIDDIYELGLRDYLPVVVVTGFPRSDLVRLAFVTHRIVDFVAKNSNNLGDVLHGVLERLDALGLRCEIAFSGEADWPSLAGYLAGDRLESMSSIGSMETVTKELHSLVRKSYADCQRVVLRPLQAGRSGSSVHQVDRYLADGGYVAPSILKLGDRRTCQREVDGWNSVREYLGGSRSTRLENSQLGPFYGALRYTLIGGGGGFRTFGDYYSESSAIDVCSCLDTLFGDTLALLKHPANRRPSALNLLEAYSGYLRLRPEAVVQGYEFKFGVPVADQRWYSHRDLDRQLPNAVRELRDGRLTYCGNTSLVLSHGDLHGDNVLVAPDGAGWIIDFGEAGFSHWARDYALLETFVRLRLLQAGDISDLYHFERLLASGGLTDPVDMTGLLNGEIRKAGAAIARIRWHAAFAASIPIEQAHQEYFFALLMTTLKYMQMHRLLDKTWRKHHLLVVSGILVERIRELAGERV